MIKLSAAALSILLLAGCSSTKANEVAPAKVMQLFAPSTCEQPSLISAFDDQVKGSKFVPADWQPSQGTDLYDVYQVGGIACTYGIQVAEIGGTVMWAQNTDNLWETKKAQWLTQGQTEIDLPGIDEADAVMLKEGSTSADEMHVWGVNLLINDVWIQVNASFLQNVDEALPIIQAAIDSLKTTK